MEPQRDAPRGLATEGTAVERYLARPPAIGGGIFPRRPRQSGAPVYRPHWGARSRRIDAVGFLRIADGKHHPRRGLALSGTRPPAGESFANGGIAARGGGGSSAGCRTLPANFASGRRQF